MTLGCDTIPERIAYAREPRKLPSVLSGDEVVRFLEAVSSLKARIALTTAYGAGLRVSEVIGLRENSNRKTGIVYVRSRGQDETGAVVLDYVRWVMVRKRDAAAAAPGDSVPELPKALTPRASTASPMPTSPKRSLSRRRWSRSRRASSSSFPAASTRAPADPGA